MKPKRADLILIKKIAARAFKMFGTKSAGPIYADTVEVMMDVTATHLNGCRLDLKKFLEAGDFDFAHDILFIRLHLNRRTGALEHLFVPRCAQHEKAVAA